MERKRVFIDTNIPIFASGKDSPFKELSIKVLEDVAASKIFGFTSVEVLQEILYRFYEINKPEKGLVLFDEFSRIIDEILPVNFKIIHKAREILEKTSGLNTRDTVHAATIEYYGIQYIATFDKHFTNFKNIRNYIRIPEVG